jgi:predicted metal-dependent hydrolase
LPLSFEVEYRRHERARRVGLRIDPSLGHVIVTLPPGTTRRVGLALLSTHAEWVTARLAALPPAVAFADGSMIPLAGRLTQIRHVLDNVATVRLQGRLLLVGGALDRLSARVGAFLHAQAQLRFAELVASKSGLAALRPGRMLLKDMRTRWGSCAGDRTLAFNWRLVMAPPFVQDYVAAHEVAHLRYMNHGPQFKALERELTRFAEPARAWLIRHGPSLLRIG